MLENRSATVNAPSLARPLNAELPSRQRARRTTILLRRSARTLPAAVASPISASLSPRLGNPTNIEQQTRYRGGRTSGLAEEARATALKDAGRADLDQVLRVQGAADRAVRD